MLLIREFLYSRPRVSFTSFCWNSLLVLFSSRLIHECPNLRGFSAGIISELGGTINCITNTCISYLFHTCFPKRLRVRSGYSKLSNLCNNWRKADLSASVFEDPYHIFRKLLNKSKMNFRRFPKTEKESEQWKFQMLILQSLDLILKSTICQTN